MKRCILILLLVFALLCGYSAAEQLPDCVLEQIQQSDDEKIVSSVVLSLPNGNQFYATWSEYQWLNGYQYNPSTGNCTIYMSISQPLENAHLAVINEDTPSFMLTNERESITWHWTEEGFQAAEWANADYTVAIEDECLVFVSRTTGQSTRTELASQLKLWMSDYDDMPKTPDEAKALAGISQEAAETLLPGFTLCDYESYNGGAEANAYYARITEDKRLQLSSLSLKAGVGIQESLDSMMIPVSEWFLEQIQNHHLKELVSANTFCNTFIYPNQTLDTAKIPVAGEILQSELQSQCLVLLTQEEDGRHLVIVTMDDSGNYATDRSNVMPGGLSMDVFHNGDGQIYLEWDEQQAGWNLNSSGEWVLNWGMNSGINWSKEYGCIRFYGDDEIRICGDWAVPALLDGNFDDFPETIEEIKGKISTDGWAVVNNPNPEDRLYLRKEPNRGSNSLGKFWNGTLVKVIETKGSWCHVTIGTNGVLEGWMMKKYLAFGDEMDQVNEAAPNLVLKDEIQLNDSSHQTWVEPWLVEGVSSLVLENNNSYKILGLAEAEGERSATLILMNSEGEVGYAPMEWFWEGSG